MNFLLRTAHTPTPDLPTVPEQSADMHSSSKPATTLEGLIAEDPFPESSTNGDGDADNTGGSFVNGSGAAPSSNNHGSIGIHLDVAGEEGFITIPYSKSLSLSILVQILIQPKWDWNESLYLHNSLLLF